MSLWQFEEIQTVLRFGDWLARMVAAAPGSSGEAKGISIVAIIEVVLIQRFAIFLGSLGYIYRRESGEVSQN